MDLAQLLSLGIKKVKVYKKIKVGIFSTGSEINKGPKKKKKNHIFDANKITLVSMLKKIGCEVIDLGLIKDDFNETKKNYREIRQNVTYYFLPEEFQTVRQI